MIILGEAVKTLAQWFALAAVALSMAAAGGDGRKAPDAATERPANAESAAEREATRHSWLNWLLPGLLRQATAPTTPPEPPPPEPPTEPTKPPPASLGAVGTKAEEQSRFFAAVAGELLAPDYAAFAEAAQALVTAARAYCTAPGSGDAAALGGAWRRAMAAWQRVQHLRTGPVEEDHRRLRIQLFPDNSGNVQRNLEGLLSGTGTISEDAVSASPVGAQGLPALEQLIFAEALAADSRRCQAAVAIADNLRTMAGEIAVPWREDGALFQAFINGTEPFLDRDDVLIALLESIAVQAEFIADRKIAPALRGGDASALESPLAAHSKENIAANLGALADLIDNEHGGIYRLRDYLRRAHSEEPVGSQLVSVAAEAQGRIAALMASFEDIVAGQAAGDGEVESLRVDFQKLSDLGVEAAVAAGVSLGFNSEDGD